MINVTQEPDGQWTLHFTSTNGHIMVSSARRHPTSRIAERYARSTAKALLAGRWELRDDDMFQAEIKNTLGTVIATTPQGMYKAPVIDTVERVVANLKKQFSTLEL